MLKALRTPTTLLNSQLLASRTTTSSLVLRVGARGARSYATETALPSASSANPVTSVGRGKKNEVPEGPLRPHLGVEVNPNHGLWAFFRKKVGTDGVQTYETLEERDNSVDHSGVFLFMTGTSDSTLCLPYTCAELRILRSVPSVERRSCVERRRTSTKEFQGSSYPLVRRPEGAKPSRDAVTRDETCGCPFGHDAGQAKYVQGKSFPFQAWVKLTLRSSFAVSENDGPYQVRHQRTPVGIRRGRADHRGGKRARGSHQTRADCSTESDP